MNCQYTYITRSGNPALCSAPAEWVIQWEDRRFSDSFACRYCYDEASKTREVRAMSKLRA